MTGYVFLNDTRIVAANEQVYSELDGEIVILKLENGVYYGLNDVGASVWSRIQEPTTLGDLTESLLEEYEVEPEQCKCELMALLQDLANNKLIEIQSGSIP